ncbi:MAG: tetratricopeptide repeat protein [Thermoanaerobaculia bacterium]
MFELLNNLPSGCRVIVTSRRRTDGSTAAHSLRLDKLERAAADELLAELGRNWEPVARLTQDERDRLYAETGGNPLLITWVAGQLGRTTGRCRTVAEAIGRLQEAHRLQMVNEKNDPLDFIFGDLVETFTEDETAVLAALVHFTQPVPIKWLLPLTELSRKAAETALDCLRDRALLIEDDQAATWMLPPLAARFLRRTHPEAVDISGERLANQAYALALENGYEDYARFPTLEAAWPQLAAALPVLIAGDNRRLQTMCSALFKFLHFYGRWDDLLYLSTEAEVRAERVGDFKSAGWRAFHTGVCYVLRGQSAEVLVCASRATTYWQKAHAGAAERAEAIRLRGLGHSLAKDHPAAIIAFREALVLWRSLSPQSRDVAMGLNSLASARRDLGQLDEAEINFRESLAIAKALQDSGGVATYTANLAELALDREQWPEAERLVGESLKLAEEIGRKELIASNCCYLAKALARQGRGAEGLCHAERAVAILTELRSPDLSEAQAVLEECLSD